MATVSLLTSINKNTKYPEYFSLVSTNNSGIVSIILDMNKWTEQMYYELPAIQILIYTTTDDKDIIFADRTMLLDTTSINKTEYSTAITNIPREFKLAVIPIYDDNALITHASTCETYGLPNTWNSATQMFPLTITFDDVDVTSDCNCGCGSGGGTGESGPSYTYSIEKITNSTDNITYRLVETINGANNYVGDTISIPYGIESGSLKICERDNYPEWGLVTGNKYIDLILSSDNNKHIYINLGNLSSSESTTIINDTVSSSVTTYSSKKIETMTKELSTNINALENEVNDVGITLDNTITDMGDLNRSLTDINVRLDNTDERLSNTNDKLRTIDDIIIDLQTTDGELIDKINNIETDISGISDVNNKIDDLNNSINNINNGINRIDTNIEDINIDIVGIENQFDNLNDSVDDLIININNNTAAITNNTNSITNIENNINLINDSLDTKVDKIDGKQLSTEDFTTELKDKLENIDPNNIEFELPIASETTLGGIKIDTAYHNIDSNTGVLSGVGKFMYTLDGTRQQVSEIFNDYENNSTQGRYAHAEGSRTTALYDEAHAEGYGTKASGQGSHAEGASTTAQGYTAHAEGYGTIARGSATHVEGYGNTAIGDYSHVGGRNNIAYSDYQTVIGKYCETDYNNKYAFIIGGGSAVNDRKNIFTVDWSGDIYANNIYTKTEIDDKLNNINISEFNLPIASNTVLGGVKIDDSTITINTDGIISCNIDTSNFVVKEPNKGLSTNDFNNTLLTKLNNIEENANNYIHPTIAGYKHIPTGGSIGQVLIWSSNGTAQWGNIEQITYNNATITADGLMSKEDKIKLDSVENNANNYILPIATNTILGGVKVDNDTITINDDGIISGMNPNTVYTKEETYNKTEIYNKTETYNKDEIILLIKDAVTVPVVIENALYIPFTTVYGIQEETLYINKDNFTDNTNEDVTE